MTGFVKDKGFIKWQRKEHISLRKPAASKRMGFAKKWQPKADAKYWRAAARPAAKDWLYLKNDKNAAPPRFLTKS
jgi:hypothetical protein